MFSWLFKKAMLKIMVFRNKCNALKRDDDESPLLIWINLAHAFSIETIQKCTS